MSKMYDEIVSVYGLQKLNTLTKYPSILTYHNLGEKGCLVNTLVEDTGFKDKKVFVTEKIDGTNTRVIAFTNDAGEVCDYLIGSREDFLFAYGDRIVNPTLGIVNTIGKFADTLMLLTKNNTPHHLPPNSICCFYGETYGGNINGNKHYTNDKTYGFRLFDMWHMEFNDIMRILENDVGRISSWREHNGQPYVNVAQLEEYASMFGISTVPYIKEIVGTEIGTTLSSVYKWLLEFRKSNAALDADYAGDGLSEGVVVRTSDRSLIRKIRFEDYERTKKRGGF